MVLPILLIAESPSESAKSIPVLPIDNPTGLFVMVGSSEILLRVKAPSIVPKEGLNNGVIIL